MNKGSSNEENNPQDVDQQIQSFKKQLEQKSNSELAAISTQLENAERSVLMEKINSQLEVIKDTVTSARAKASGGTDKEISPVGQATVSQAPGPTGITSLAGQSSLSAADLPSGGATSDSAVGNAPNNAER